MRPRCCGCTAWSSVCSRSNEEKQMNRIRSAWPLAALFAAAPVLGHHGISNWDLNKDLTLNGKLTQLDFISPHAWLHMEVKGADGKPQAWSCEMRSAAALHRSGWTLEMFKVGSTITVTGSSERYKPRQCYLTSITFAD